MIGLLRKISTTLLWMTLNWVPKNFRISKKDSSSLCRILNPADSESWGIPKFCKTLNSFSGILVKIHKILGNSSNSSLSIYYRISNVFHGGVWIFSGIAQYSFSNCIRALQEEMSLHTQVTL